MICRMAHFCYASKRVDSSSSGRLPVNYSTDEEFVQNIFYVSNWHAISYQKLYIGFYLFPIRCYSTTKICNTFNKQQIVKIMDISRDLKNRAWTKIFGSKKKTCPGKK
jgi:hypothetical protein